MGSVLGCLAGLRNLYNKYLNLANGQLKSLILQCSALSKQCHYTAIALSLSNTNADEGALMITILKSLPQ